MKILNFGSCCIDNVYSVPHFVQPGETLSCTDFNVYPGGKGLNQSIALANAGAEVYHAGKLGEDGIWLKRLLESHQVDVSRLQVVDGNTGHANIQVVPSGENAIVIFGGTNRKITPDDFEQAFTGFDPGDMLVLQNEVSHLGDLIETGHKQGLRIAFNAAPMTSEVLSYPLQYIEFLLVNETEAAGIAGTESPLETLLDQYPNMKVILTLGEQGAIYQDSNQKLTQAAYPVDAVDTTGAGDTFTGFFLAAIARGEDEQTSLQQACRAASLSVTKAGAATSIPNGAELGL